MTGWTNVAPGSPGYVVRDLHNRGLLKRTDTPTLTDPYASRYTITRVGRALLAKHARQALAVKCAP